MYRLLPILFLLAVAVPARPQVEAKPLSHADPEHIWNRLHRHVYQRDANVSPDDREPLSPLFGSTPSSFLTRGQSHQDALALLDEFLKVPPERRIREPLKRAVLQHDLWEAFTSTTEPAQDLDDRPQRREIQKRLVQAMQAVALSPREIETLPDNLAAAVKSGKLPEQFDTEHPVRPFLPPDLLAKDGPWVAVASPTRSDEVAAPMHVETTKARAVFTVFLRLPAGRKATEAYVKRMEGGALPELPEGAQTALLRRWLLIDDQGQLRATPLTESLQLRVYGKDDMGLPFVFRLRRGELFADRAGGLQPLSLKDVNCASCHARLEGQGVRTIATLYAGDRTKPGLKVVDAGEQAAKTITWHKSTPTWGLLQGLWKTEPSHESHQPPGRVRTRQDPDPVGP
jgi:hypothetical protein